jgi:hypothetical protein
MAGVAAGAAAGTGATATLVASADQTQGHVVVTTGTGTAAGTLATITLDIAPIADLDAAMVAQGMQNGGVFHSLGLVLTAWGPPLPPAGVVTQVIGRLQQGSLTGIAIVASGPLAASTSYRFSYRVL